MSLKNKIKKDSVSIEYYFSSIFKKNKKLRKKIKKSIKERLIF